MRISLLFASLCAALAVQAAPGEYSTKAASGSSTASVLFPASAPLRVVAYDVTADNATNRLFFYPGSTRATVAAPAASSATAVIFRETAFTTNNLVFLQNAANEIAIGTVTIRTQSTNRAVPLLSSLGTNLAAGDVVRKRLSTAYQPVVPADASATTLHLDSLAGLTTNDVLVLDRGSGNALKTAVVSIVQTNSRRTVRFDSVLPTDVSAGERVHIQHAGNPISPTVSAAAGTTNLYLLSGAGIQANTNLFISQPGRSAIVTVHAITGTNVSTKELLPFTVSTGAQIRVLAPATSTAMAASAGADSVTLVTDALTGSAAAQTLAISNAQPFRLQTAAAPVTNSVRSLTVASAFGAIAHPSHSIYKLTNNTTVVLPALETDASIVVAASTGWSLGDTLIISPASGGVFANRISGTITPDVITTVTFSGQIGVALDKGDRAWLRGTPASTLVGNATLRNEGAALYAHGANVPLQVLITGASACSLNSVTVKFDY